MLIGALLSMPLTVLVSSLAGLMMVFMKSEHQLEGLIDNTFVHSLTCVIVTLLEKHFMFLLGSRSSFVSVLLAATQIGVGVGVIRKFVALDAIKI